MVPPLRYGPKTGWTDKVGLGSITKLDLAIDHVLNRVALGRSPNRSCVDRVGSSIRSSICMASFTSVLQIDLHTRSSGRSRLDRPALLDLLLDLRSLTCNPDFSKCPRTSSRAFARPQVIHSSKVTESNLIVMQNARNMQMLVQKYSRT